MSRFPPDDSDYLFRFICWLIQVGDVSSDSIDALLPSLSRLQNIAKFVGLFLAALPKFEGNLAIPTLSSPSFEDSKLCRWLVHELIESPVGFTNLALISALPPTDGMAILESLIANPSFFRWTSITIG
jgi:hypothetical protein